MVPQKKGYWKRAFKFFLSGAYWDLVSQVRICIGKEGLLFFFLAWLIRGSVWEADQGSGRFCESHSPKVFGPAESFLVQRLFHQLVIELVLEEEEDFRRE